MSQLDVNQLQRAFAGACCAGRGSWRRSGALVMPLLFSYGMLQQDAVQLSTFGRLLEGEPDELIGFELGVLRIEDPEFVAASGKANHAIVKFTGRNSSRVSGMVFTLSDSELANADAYEPAGYARVSAMLASGKEAWVYTEAKDES